MKEENFIEKNLEKWQKLENYNKQLVKKGITWLSKEELQEFTELFRITGHHLAYARTHYKDGKTVLYLNQLTGISHNFFYTRDGYLFKEIIDYFKTGFPSAVRRDIKFFLASLMIFLAGAVFIYILGLVDSTYLFYLLPEDIVSGLNVGRELSNDTWYYPIFSTFIISNNIRVCALAFAYGFLAGIGTIYVLFQNGLIIGALTCLVAVNRLGMVSYLSLILPHGFIELTAIFISGCAGLVFGRSILLPGDLSRKDSLIKGGRQGAYLIPGVAVMLVIAGLIEGFFTPLNIPDGLKLVFAAITLALLIVYFGRNGLKTSKNSAVFNG